MATPPQDVYATNLHQNCGYPLRTPELSSELGKPYDKEGLQIGDVGYVNDYGAFVPLFNARFPVPDHLRERGVPPYEPINLQKPYTESVALPKDYVFMTGVKQDLDERSGVVYKFAVTSNTGAVLILPYGASLSEVQNQHELEVLRDVATKFAPAWCEFAKRDSLFLVTGVYKTRSWALGSFDKGRPGEEILVERQNEKSGGDAPMYKWRSTFQVDHRSGLKYNTHENQAIFIKGFKMTTRWAGWSFAVVEFVPGSQSAAAFFVALLFAFLSSLLTSSAWPSGVSTVEHSPH